VRRGKLTPEQQRAVDSLAAATASILTDQWAGDVVGQVNAWVGPSLTGHLQRGNHYKHCRRLARLARDLIKARNATHNVAGSLTYWTLEQLRVGYVVAALGRELTRRLPLPSDESLTASARAVQSLGIALCVMDGRPLDRCPCAVAVASDLSAQVGARVLEAAARDLVQLRLAV
jgi:hypothetical protein